MPKAKLTTRERTTSNVSTDTLAKGTQLTHAEADSNFINLRDQSFGIADDTSTVLQVSADKTITVAGAKGITTSLSGDTLTITGGTGDLSFVGSSIVSPSNGDITLDPSGTGVINNNATVRFNTNYKEDIVALTSATTRAVDCSLASVFTVTLAHSATFNFSNLATGQSVSLIIRQDGSGSKTGTFTSVLFPSNKHTLSTGNNEVDFVSIFNDGTSLLGNLSKDYS